MFKIHKIYNSRAMAFCPKHKSQKGTADLDISLEGSYAGYYHCWGCGYSGRISDADLEQLRKMRGEYKEELVTMNWEKLNSQCLKERLFKCPESPFKVSPLIMAQLQWGFYEGTHTFPERDEYDNVIGILRRWPDGNKGMISGSQRGIYIPRMGHSNEENLYITEGVSDLSVILECGLFGIGRSNCDHGDEMIKEWIRIQDWQGKIIIIGDYDKAGMKGAFNLQQFIKSDEVYYPIDPAKDLREMYETIGLKETREWLLD